MEQLELFDKQPGLPKHFDKLSVSSPSICFKLCKGLDVGYVLWEIVKRNLKIDWLKLHEEFELEGHSTYLDITIGFQEFKIIDLDGYVFFNENHLMSWGEEDYCDSKMKTKIKNSIKSFIFNNKYQFNIK